MQVDNWNEGLNSIIAISSKAYFQDLMLTEEQLVFAKALLNFYGEYGIPKNNPQAYHELYVHHVTETTPKPMLKAVKDDLYSKLRVNGFLERNIYILEKCST